MSSKLALMLVVLVAIVACVQAQPSRPYHSDHPEKTTELRPSSVDSFNHIDIGRFTINISEAPYQVSLQYFDSHFCGGSVLNNKWVLTAAYCAREKSVSHLKVRLGSSRHASGGNVVHIKRIVEHPLYNGKFDYNFCLMELESEISFSDDVQPVALPEQDEPVETGTMATVSGWGVTFANTVSDAVLRAANVPIVSQKDCRHTYGVKAITDRMLCAGYHQGRKDDCRNDGSPLVADGKLIGVVSWGYLCIMPGIPGIYGRVANVRDWVRELSGA